jgi:UPF0288 family protein (methanogenesis marker protein 3)
MAREIKVERRKGGTDGEAVIVLTEPQETRYTLDQVQQEVEMADMDVKHAQQQQTVARAKLAEAKKALKGSA